MRLPAVLGLGAALGGFVGAVLGQQQMPACAAQCLEQSLKAQSVCTPTNTTCICTNGPLNAAVQACVGQACSIKQTLTALNVTATMCESPIRDRTYIPTTVASVTGGLALIAVIMRCTYALIQGTFGWDDACAAGAGLFVIPMNAVQLPIGGAGFGRDIWTVSFSNIVFILKMVYLTQVFYWPISAFTKLAFLFFYLRIFPRKELRRYVFAAMGLTFIYYMFYQFGNIFYCHPISYVWEGWDGEHKGKCLDSTKFQTSAAVVNIGIDFIIMVLPVYDIMQLNLSWRRRFYLLAMFSVGGFTLLVSILRVQQITHYATSTNATWDNVPADYWSIMEANIGVFCVCMPALRRLLARQFPRCFGSTNDSENTPNIRIYNSTKGSSKRMRPTIGGSLLYDTNITKTTDTKITTTTAKHEEDEIHLVDLERRGGTNSQGYPSATGSRNGSQ